MSQYPLETLYPLFSDARIFFKSELEMDWIYRKDYKNLVLLIN